MELERARRADQPLSLIVGDLDRFKRVNDMHGHAAGDDVLRRVADAIRGAKRGFDRAARIGGEEFAILAPDSDEHGAYMLAERIRAAVHEAFADGRQPAHDQLRDLDPSAPRPVGRRPASHRGPGALRRQAPRPQPLGDLERGGAGHPRARGAPSEQRGTRGAGRRSSTLPRRSTCATAEAPPIASASAASRSSRPASSACRPSPWSAYASQGSCTTLAAWPCRTRWWKSRGRSRMRNGPGCAPIRPSALAWWRPRSTTTFAPGSCSITSVRTATGTPRAARDDVPLEAAIIAVADAYEAMTSDRPYRPALAPEEASDELRREAGRQFHPDVVEALLRAV